MKTYIQISNYNGRKCGNWDYAPNDTERVIEFNKNRQENEPQLFSNAEYHTTFYCIINE